MFNNLGSYVSSFFSGKSSTKTFVKNFGSLFFSELFSKIMQFIIFVVLAREYGSIEFGTFGFGLSMAFFISIFVDFGLHRLLIREISRNKTEANRYLMHGLYIKLILLPVVFLFIFIYFNIFSYSKNTIIVTLYLCGSTIINSFNQVPLAVFRAFQKMEFDAIIKTLRSIILFGGLLFLLAYKQPLVSVAQLFLFIEILLFIVSLYIIIKYFIKINFIFSIKLALDLISKTKYFALAVAFTSIYFYIDTIMLSIFHTQQSVGIYTAAYQLIIGLIFIPSMFSVVILPITSLKNKNSLQSIYNRANKYMLYSSALISTVLLFFSNELIHILYGPQYQEASKVISILSFFVILKFINITTGTILISLNMESKKLFAQFVTVLSNIFLNLLLIPKYGIIGAAVATLITECIFFLMYHIIIYFNAKISINIKKMLPNILLVIFIWVLLLISNSIIMGIISLMIYLIGSYYVFSKNDKTMIKSLLRKSSR